MAPTLAYRPGSVITASGHPHYQLAGGALRLARAESTEPGPRHAGPRPTACRALPWHQAPTTVRHVSRPDTVELYDETSGYTMAEGSYGQVRNDVPVGFRVKLEAGMVTTVALCTGRPARVNGRGGAASRPPHGLG
jgi:hypothetical protein